MDVRGIGLVVDGIEWCDMVLVGEVEGGYDVWYVSYVDFYNCFLSFEGILFIVFVVYFLIIVVYKSMEIYYIEF